MIVVVFVIIYGLRSYNGTEIILWYEPTILATLFIYLFVVCLFVCLYKRILKGSNWNI